MCVQHFRYLRCRVVGEVTHQRVGHCCPELSTIVCSSVVLSLIDCVSVSLGRAEYGNGLIYCNNYKHISVY